MPLSFVNHGFYAQFSWYFSISVTVVALFLIDVVRPILEYMVTVFVLYD